MTLIRISNIVYGTGHEWPKTYVNESLCHFPCLLLGKDRQESGKDGTDDGEDEESDEDEGEEPKEEKGSKKGLLMSDSDSEEEDEEGEKGPKAAKSSFEERQSRWVGYLVGRRLFQKWLNSPKGFKKWKMQDDFTVLH